MRDRTWDCVRSGKRILAAVCVIGILLEVAIGRAQSPSVVTQLFVSANKRYLVDQNGVPFLMQGDSAQSLIVMKLTDPEVEQYLENRRQKGFNAIVLNLIEHRFSVHPPLNAAGEAPFTTPGDFSTPNEKYFAHVDWVIKKAGEHGIMALLYPIYMGVPSYDNGPNEGWYDELAKLSPEKCLEYGQFLGKRYKDYANIIWVMGADRDPPPVIEKIDLIALGIKEYDKRHLFTAHGAPEESAAPAFSQGGWLDFNTTYTYGVVQQKLLDDYNKPTMSYILMEATYEGEHNSTEVQIRRQAYWSILSGAFGHVFGNNLIWRFDGPFHTTVASAVPLKGTWQQAMDLPGSVAMMYWGRFFHSRAWYDLVPDQDHVVVTKGLGEETGTDYLAAARTSDGSTVIAYMPTSRTITVDMSKISGAQATGWWFNPRTGQATTAGTFPTSGMKEFSPPAEGDWALVLDDASKQRPAPGTVQ